MNETNNIFWKTKHSWHCQSARPTCITSTAVTHRLWPATKMWQDSESDFRVIIIKISKPLWFEDFCVQTSPGWNNKYCHIPQNCMYISITSNVEKQNIRTYEIIVVAVDWLPHSIVIFFCPAVCLKFIPSEEGAITLVNKRPRLFETNVSVKMF